MISLFVKTWINDFQWLKQAMISVQKTCAEEVKWGICIDNGTRNEINPVLVQVEQESRKPLSVHVVETSEKWPEATKIKDGYLRQQWIKMNAHLIMGDGFFWVWDSDLIAQRPFSSRDFLGFGDKPIYWFTQFNSMMGGSDDEAHRLRQQTIRDIYGVPEVPFEWMRCHPIPQNGGILRHASSTSYWKKSFDMLCANTNGFSEFNVIGQFYYQNFPDVFDWRNTHNWPEKTFSGGMGDKSRIVSQGYSWGGIPKSVEDYVRSL